MSGIDPEAGAMLVACGVVGVMTALMYVIAVIRERWQRRKWERSQRRK